jgi:formate dehydrogenase subunit gamma
MVSSSAAAGGRSGAGSGAKTLVERFDGVERAVHWATALIMLELIATGMILYIPSFSLAVGHRGIMEAIHVFTGLALLVPLIIGIAGPWRAKLVADIRRFDQWSQADWDWFHTKQRRSHEPLGKFNGGQKAEASLLGGGMVVMLVTGAIMRFGPARWVTWAQGATLVHDAGFLLIGFAVGGHLYVALTKPDQLKAIFTGRISRAWARRHAPAWLEEIDGEAESVS